jgi:hypothetical protein
MLDGDEPNYHGTSANMEIQTVTRIVFSNRSKMNT